MTGSFHTMVTHGFASEGDLVRREVGLDLDRARGRHGAHGGTAPRSDRWPYADPVRASTALLTDHYELTMLQAALAVGHGAPALGLRAVPAAAARGAPVRRGGRRRPGARRDRGLPLRRRGARGARATSSTSATPRVAGDVPLHRRRLGLRRGRGLLPLLPAADRRGHLRRGGAARDACCCRSTTTTRAIASAASRMTMAAGDRPCIEMGSRRTHEEAAVACRARGVRRRLRDHLQPRGPAAVRRPDGRHQRAQLHAAARHRGRRVPRPGRPRSAPGTTLLVDTYDVARGGPRSASRSPARSSARSASTPATSACSPTRCAPSSTTLGATEHPDRGDQRPRRVRDRRAGRGAGRRRTASAPSWSPAAGTRPAASSTSSSPARATTARWSSVAKKSTDKISIGGRKYALRRRSTARRRRGRGDRHRRAARRTTATTARCWCRWSATARSSAASRSTTPATGTPRARGRAAAGRPADVARRAGHPDDPRGQD